MTKCSKSGCSSRDDLSCSELGVVGEGVWLGVITVCHTRITGHCAWLKAKNLILNIQEDNCALSSRFTDSNTKILLGWFLKRSGCEDKTYTFTTAIRWLDSVRYRHWAYISCQPWIFFAAPSPRLMTLEKRWSACFFSGVKRISVDIDRKSAVQFTGGGQTSHGQCGFPETVAQASCQSHLRWRHMDKLSEAGAYVACQVKNSKKRKGQRMEGELDKGGEARCSANKPIRKK